MFMDFTEFIRRKEEIEVALKPGLYIVAQNLPANQLTYRCGLAGKPRDSATEHTPSRVDCRGNRRCASVV